jgi:hypothetical protein
MEQQGHRNRNGMIPYHLIPGILHLGHGGNQPRMMISTQEAHAYVLDHHFILNQHNINPVFRHNVDRIRNQPRVSTQHASAAYDVQDGHFILHENIGQVNRQAPTRGNIGATRRRYNTDVDRNQARVSTQDASSSAYAYNVQDGHFILHENIGQVNQQVPTRRSDIGGGTRKQFEATLEKVIIQQVPTDSEAMTCSICLVEFSVGLEAVRLPSPCSHVYHKDCILEWLDRSSTCPLCRRPVL